MKLLTYLPLILLLPSLSWAMFPTCQLSNSDSDGDGWGWENNMSCKVDPGTPVDPDPDPDPTCIDPDGDGWGWDGTQSCRPGSQPEPEPNPQCIDTDGDGWGWDGTQSCRPGGQPEPEPEPENPNTLPGECAPLSANETAISESSTLRSNGNSAYPDAGPQSVGPGGQFDGPGLRFGDFLAINNAWNGSVSTHQWNQTMSLIPQNGQYTWALDYDWGDEYDILAGRQEWEVKAYPELIFGVKSAKETSGSCAQTGLPAQYKNLPEIDLSFSYSATETSLRQGTNGPTQNDPPVFGGDRNIAIESFFHGNCQISRGQDGDTGPSNTKFEVMVWLDHGPERLPSGSAPAAVYVDEQGRAFDVYTKSQDRAYIAFVAQNKLSSGTLNWNEFINYARNNDTRLGMVEFQDNWCLANILFGSEIWWGQGSLRLNSYSITRKY